MCALRFLVSILFASAAVGGSGQDAEPAWEKLKAGYSYRSKFVTDVYIESRDDPAYVVEHISFHGRTGDLVPGLFVRPKAEGRYPCVLLLHGLTSRKEVMNVAYGRALAAKGVASFALDADQHGERVKPNGARTKARDFNTIMREGVVDYRIAIDLLQSRDDIDPRRIGVFGYSMGAMMGAILGGVDDRVRAAVLCVGGDLLRGGLLPGAAKVTAAQLASPANFIGHMSPRPVYFINGKTDNIVTKVVAKAVHDAAKEPKEIVWVEAGHMLPKAATDKGLDWIVAKLKAR